MDPPTGGGAAGGGQEAAALPSIAKRRGGPHTLVLEHVSPATRLLEKRRQMFEVQEALEAQKQEFNRKEEVFKRREDGLKKKDLELQESLIRFSKFLQENDSKRTRAEKKAEEERKLRQLKEREIEGLQQQLGDLRSEKDRTSEVVERNMRYQSYLERVLEYADEYHEINELLMRHETLQATNKDLRDHLNNCEEENENTRSELQTYTKEATDRILSLNNTISKLKKELEERERVSQKIESHKDYVLQDASRKIEELGQVHMSTDNIFQRCHSQSTVGHPLHSATLDQLTVVGDYMSDLRAITKEWQRTKHTWAPATTPRVKPRPPKEITFRKS